ncbi:hypothetical protein BO71DRAFT_413938 [Aspergillus ellipticus CBS 707.79]|uniref:Rhodopsin domain-containing protein n=1 Tax=Aspergillus ellipticus CBS 707.79 TaxID=1448320 RepID=A0A319EC20_9EURO|nr:hypothetical protein BO71DRAFT_413938 [Aspergillus ellipticus CBS 707.79]
MATFDTDVDFSESRATEINVIGSSKQSVRAATDLSRPSAAFVSYSATLGLGRHTAAVIADHGMERYEMTAKWQIIVFRAFSFPNIFITILVSYLLDPNPLRTRCLYVMVTLQVVFAIVSVFIVFLQCTPTQKMWNASLEGTCWSSAVFDDFSYWVSTYTTMTDIVLAVMPIILWGLYVPSFHLPTTSDSLSIEQNVVIVAACIPTLRPFFRKAFESKNSRSGTDSRTRSGSALKLSSNPLHSGSQCHPS